MPAESGVILRCAGSIPQLGVVNGRLPGDTPAVFGRTLTGSRDFAVFYAVGLLVHFINGGDFDLFYAFVRGKRRSYLPSAQ